MATSMDAIKILSTFMAGLFRIPDHAEDPTHWRVVVVMAILLLILGLSLHVASVSGSLERFGIHGTASTADVRELKQQTVGILYALYAPQIRAKIRERCDTNDRREREHINKELDRILREYRDAAGKEFEPLPQCSQV